MWGVLVVADSKLRLLPFLLVPQFGRLSSIQHHVLIHLVLSLCGQPPKYQRLPVIQHNGPQQVSKLDKVFLKATYKGKKEVKKFTLRNVDPTLIRSSGDLKDLKCRRI